MSLTLNVDLRGGRLLLQPQLLQQARRVQTRRSFSLGERAKEEQPDAMRWNGDLPVLPNTGQHSWTPLG